MNTNELTALVTQHSNEVDGRRVLPCAVALRIASECNVAPREIGAICDDSGIKIVGCQLGCFGK
jgi:hypothetical protein